jgi:RNA-directed DNA polymerase
LDAVAQNAREGYRWVVDADLEQFFDTLDHQRLMEALRRRISDGEVLRLIYRWLKAGYLWEGSFHDTDQGSPQGGVLSPLLANVYLHTFDRAQQAQKSFIGRLVRYADDFVIQCGTRRHAERAVQWAREYLTGLGLRLHPEKTQVVGDREGFDFLGFHHRRVPMISGAESKGVRRWPGRKAQQRFRDRIRPILGSPLQLREHWGERMKALERYLRGYCQYYRHGHSYAVFLKLDYYVACRVARTYARSQPYGKKRRRRNWLYYRRQLWEQGRLPKLTQLRKGRLATHVGR